MTTIVTILTEGFADWETALLNAAARSFYGVTTLYASPGGEPVTSSGGMKVVPELDVTDIDPGAIDALVVCGGTIWQTPAAPDLSALLISANAKGKLVAGICDGTLQLAKAGLLDAIPHTSNSAGHLDATGYKGKPHYRDGAKAVREGNIVTAAGTSATSFMAETMAGLGLADANLSYYLGLHAAQFEETNQAV